MLHNPCCRQEFDAVDVANVTSGHDEQCSQPESKRWLLVRPKIHLDGILPVEWTHILVDGIWNWDVLPDMTHHITSLVVIIFASEMSRCQTFSKDKLVQFSVSPRHELFYKLHFDELPCQGNPTANCVSNHWRTAMQNSKVTLPSFTSADFAANSPASSQLQRSCPWNDSQASSAPSATFRCLKTWHVVVDIQY